MKQTRTFRNEVESLLVEVNSPSFSFSNADSASRLFDRFEDVIADVIANPGRARINLTSYSRTTDIFVPERCMHLTVTQETHIGNSVEAVWWESSSIDHGTNVVGILPLPAFINKGVPQSPREQFDQQGMMLFFDESGMLTQDTAYITGFLTSYLPHRAVSWQKADSMTPEIINPTLAYRGIQEGDLLDQSTINGMFNKITNFLHGLYTKTASHASVLTSLLVTVKRLSIRIKEAEGDIERIFDFNPVGTITAMYGELTSEQRSYFVPCDGSQVPQSAKDDPRYMEINVRLHKMLNDGSDFNENTRYRVPDLSGRVLVNRGSVRTVGLDLKGDSNLTGEASVASRELIMGEQSGIANNYFYSEKIRVNGGSGSGSTDAIIWTQRNAESGDVFADFTTKHEGAQGGFTSGRRQQVMENYPPYCVVNYIIRVIN